MQWKNAVAESRRLLVIVDLTSDAQPAVERAVWLAERLGATVELFVCDYDPRTWPASVSTTPIPYGPLARP